MKAKALDKLWVEMPPQDRHLLCDVFGNGELDMREAVIAELRRAEKGERARARAQTATLPRRISLERASLLAGMVHVINALPIKGFEVRGGPSNPHKPQPGP